MKYDFAKKITIKAHIILGKVFSASDFTIYLLSLVSTYLKQFGHNVELWSI